MHLASAVQHRVLSSLSALKLRSVIGPQLRFLANALDHRLQIRWTDGAGMMTGNTGLVSLGILAGKPTGG